VSIFRADFFSSLLACARPAFRKHDMAGLVHVVGDSKMAP
jgi:hypothetical protein